MIRETLYTSIGAAALAVSRAGRGPATTTAPVPAAIPSQDASAAGILLVATATTDV